MGRTRDDLKPGLRGHPVGEYVIIYAIDNEDVVILRVFDGRSNFESAMR